MLADRPDGELASLATREAFEILFHRHRHPVFNFIARQVTDLALAEDLFQTVFLKAFRSIRSFRAASRTLAIAWAPYAWGGTGPTAGTARDR